MSAKQIVIASVAAAMFPLVPSAAMDEIEPECGMEPIAAAPAALACHEKQAQLNHVERDNTPKFYPQTVGVTVTRPSGLTLMGVG